MHGRGRVVDLSESALRCAGGGSMTDHYPFYDNDRAAFLADVAAMLVAAPPAYPPPTRIRIRYGIVYCEVCNLAVQYCPCHPPPDAPESKGVQAELLTRRDGRA